MMMNRTGHAVTPPSTYDGDESIDELLSRHESYFQRHCGHGNIKKVNGRYEHVPVYQAWFIANGNAQTLAPTGPSFNTVDMFYRRMDDEAEARKPRNKKYSFSSSYFDPFNQHRRK